ncbi:MAG: Holliday junction resolvase RuvX [Gammaproteobacteria bacterium]|nr:Holliday junction resolvase RuvX [Gammaproteobacteria bacterium]
MSLERFPTTHKSELTALGFDYGTQRIGVAFGQSVSGTARALPILSARDGIPDWDQVQKLIDSWQPDVLVVGMPFNMDGSESELMQRARKFANRLHGRFHLPCYGIDERLSSHAAEELTGNRDEAIDSVAAQLILETWFYELKTFAREGSH